MQSRITKRIYNIYINITSYLSSNSTRDNVLVLLRVHVGHIGETVVWRVRLSGEVREKPHIATSIRATSMRDVSSPDDQIPWVQGHHQLVDVVRRWTSSGCFFVLYSISSEICVASPCNFRFDVVVLLLLCSFFASCRPPIVGDVWGKACSPC